AEVFELNDSGAPDAFADIACEIKHRVLWLLRLREELSVGGVGCKEARNKLRTDFIIRLPDGWTECGGNSVAIGANALHRRDGCFNHACERSAPTCMGGAYYSRLTIGKQQPSAVRRRYSDRQGGYPGADCVRPRAGVARPRLVRYNDVGRMDLICCQQATRTHA